MAKVSCPTCGTSLDPVIERCPNCDGIVQGRFGSGVEPGSGEPIASKPRQRRSLLGCIGCGCIAALLIIVLFVAALGFFAWRFYQSLFSARPLPIETVVVTRTERDALAAKLSQLGTAYAKGNMESHTLSLNETELNLLLESLGDALGSTVGRPRLRGHLAGHTLELLASLPWDAETYLNVEVKAQVRIRDEALTLLRVEKLRVGKHDLAWPFARGFVSGEGQGRPLLFQNQEPFSRLPVIIEDAEVRQGILHVRVRPRPGASGFSDIESD